MTSLNLLLQTREVSAALLVGDFDELDQDGQYSFGS
jgi:hypothetical protein